MEFRYVENYRERDKRTAVLWFIYVLFSASISTISLV